MKHFLYLSFLISTLLSIIPINGRAPAVHLNFNIGRRVVPIKGAVIVEEELETTVRDDGSGILWRNTALYGISEHLGLRLFIPVFLKRKVGNDIARGLSDISLEALLIKFLQPYNAGILGLGFFAPTGSIKSRPNLGTGNYNLIFTAQWIHSSPHWYCSFFLRPVGAIKRHGRYAGSILNFEYLFGPKFILGNSKLPLATLLILDGAYRKPAKINGLTVPNTGGTVVILGPFISVRTGRMIVQGRVQFPILQRYRGTQEKLNYIAAATVQYYF
ncbi:MAG: hypothetical protein AB7F19_01740 [Candidatus Babeliales bacterium]